MKINDVDSANMDTRFSMSRVSPSCPSRDVRGFSLIELMIAMAVLLIGLLAYGALLPMAIRMVDHSAGISQATAITQQRLETVRRMGFGPLATMAGQPYAAPPNDPASSTETVPGTNQTTFTVRTWVQILSGTAPRRTAAVTVITTWLDGTLPRSVRLDTVAAE